MHQNVRSPMPDIHKYYHFLKEEDIILSYNGSLDGELLDIIIQLVDQKLHKLKTRTRIKKKVINILVECLQNSFHYIKAYPEDEQLSNSTFLVLSKKDDKFYIFTGNYVKSEQADFLEQKISKITAFNEEELQAYYLEALNKEELPQEGGAGLGLVDIMRRSKHQVEFDLEQIEEHYSLFGLQVCVN